MQNVNLDSSTAFQAPVSAQGLVIFKTNDNGDGTVCPMIAVDGPVAIDSGTPVNVSVANTVPVTLSAGVIANMPVYSYRRINGAGTTVVKSGAGTLRRIIVNTPVTLSTVTVYDNTAGSGTIIATISSIVGQSYQYDVAFVTGLTIVVTIGVDITVIYQ